MGLFSRDRNKAPDANTARPVATAAGNVVLTAALQERVIDPEELTAALEKLRLSIDPAVDELEGLADCHKYDKKSFMHQGPDPGERLIVEPVFQLEQRQPKELQDVSPEVPVGARHGQAVTLLSDSDFSRPQLSPDDNGLTRGNAGLIFMDDGQVLYRAFAGEQMHSHWADIGNLAPGMAMYLVEHLAAGVEYHRANP